MGGGDWLEWSGLGCWFGGGESYREVGGLRLELILGTMYLTGGDDEFSCSGFEKTMDIAAVSGRELGLELLVMMRSCHCHCYRSNRHVPTLTTPCTHSRYKTCNNNNRGEKE